MVVVFFAFFIFSFGRPELRIMYVYIHVASRRQPPAPHRSLLLPLFSSIAVAPRQEPLCGRHGLNDVVLTPSRPLVTANDVGHWDQKHPKVLIVGKKNAKNLIARYSGPTQFKKKRKTWKNGEIAVIYSVFARWEAETTANTMVFEGQVGKNTVIYSVFLTNVKKHWYLRCFHSHRNIKQCNLRGFWKFWS